VRFDTYEASYDNLSHMLCKIVDRNPVNYFDVLHFLNPRVTLHAPSSWAHEVYVSVSRDKGTLSTQPSLIMNPQEPAPDLAQQRARSDAPIEFASTRTTLKSRLQSLPCAVTLEH
jgi:hypothetical protein